MNYMTVRTADRNLGLRNDFDRMLDSFFNSAYETKDVRTPVSEIHETAEGLEMSVELPGFSSDDLEVKVEENLLSIRAAHKEKKKEKKQALVRTERQDIRFEKSFVLSKDIDAAKIEAHLKNGLLTLILPRIEKAAPLNITVKG